MSETAPEFQPKPPGPMGVDKKWWIIGGVAAAGVVWFAYKRAKTNSANATGAGDAIDPNTGLPYSSEGAIDPSTGVPYSQELGSQGYSPVFGGAGPTPVQVSPTINVHEAKPATNAEWYARAVKALVHHGVTLAHAQRVLAMYLTKLPLTEDDIAIVEHAVRLIGPPPNPPTIHRVATPTRHPKRKV